MLKKAKVEDVGKGTLDDAPILAWLLEGDGTVDCQDLTDKSYW